MRRKFNAAHTSFHSARTLANPRKLNRRNHFCHLDYIRHNPVKHGYATDTILSAVKSSVFVEVVRVRVKLPFLINPQFLINVQELPEGKVLGGILPP